MVTNIIYITQYARTIILTYEPKSGFVYRDSMYRVGRFTTVLWSRDTSQQYRHDAIANLLCNEAIVQGMRAVDVRYIGKQAKKQRTISDRQKKLF